MYPTLEIYLISHIPCHDDGSWTKGVATPESAATFGEAAPPLISILLMIPVLLIVVMYDSLHELKVTTVPEGTTISQAVQT
jgi:hypothetical protein